MADFACVLVGTSAPVVHSVAVPGRPGRPGASDPADPPGSSLTIPAILSRDPESLKFEGRLEEADVGEG